MDGITLGAKVRVARGWPRQVGRIGTVVAPPEAGYPQPGHDEVIVHLDDEPWHDPADPTRSWLYPMHVGTLTAAD